MYIRIRCIAKVLIKRILLLAFASFLTLSFKNANSQEVNVSGTVMCAETGRLLKDVKIIVPQKKIIALTDMDGGFSVQLNQNETSSLVFDKPGFIVSEKSIKDLDGDLEIKLKTKKISAASYRMRKYIESESAYNTLTYKEEPGWRFNFEESDLKGDFEPDPKYVRRDPSAVIKIGDLYYVYYSRGLRYSKGPIKKDTPWDQCDIWYATSKDGWTWDEKGAAVVRGKAGSFDEQSVFTPEVLAHEGKYYLVYQAAPSPYNDRTFNVVGMAVAESPDGPWKKLAKPVLKPTPNGYWVKDSGTGRIPEKVGDFDSHKVHDPCILYYKNKFYLYYKGQRVGENRFWDHREIMWGVAIADKPEGPYVKSEYNPITNTGHEVCVWKYKGGVALIHTVDGPEEKTVQWSPDGINFEIMSTVENTPEALGLFRTDDHDKSPQEGVRWGLCHAHGGEGHWKTRWNYIKRFDLVK